MTKVLRILFSIFHKIKILCVEAFKEYKAFSLTITMMNS